MERADIYIPRDEEMWRWLAACGATLEMNGWEYGRLFRDWPDVVRLACRGEADIIVVPSRSLLPAGRRPLLVAADEQPTDPSPFRGPDIPQPRRPQRLRPRREPR